MKILFLSTTAGLLNKKGSGSYNGCGWVAGLQKAILQYDNGQNQWALAFIDQDNLLQGQPVEEEGFTYYPMTYREPTAWQKLKRYWYQYKHPEETPYLTDIQRIVADYKPDVVQIFGTESPFFHYVAQCPVPCVTHIQGILSPYSETFFPQGMSKEKVLKYGDKKREWLLHNYLCFAYNDMRVRARLERERLLKAQNVMGRTAWDRDMMRLLAPQARYYHVDEAIRDVFYEAEKWQLTQREELRIVSTLSETMYKGLDVVLRTAQLMRQRGISFRWIIAGIKPGSPFVRLFERVYGISSSQVGVEYAGVLSASELISLLHEATVYVHPSYIENSPNSVCEAQMIGVPVVGCRVGGVSTLIRHGETGWLVPPNGVYELAALLQNYFQMPIEKISENEIAAAKKRHDKQKIFSDLLACYAACQSSSTC